jgi:hypothetical protein
MPGKGASSKKNNAISPKKIPRFGGKRMVVLCAVLVIAVIGGIYGLRNGLAYRTSPSMVDCMHPSYRPKLYRGVPNQGGCVAAVQGFYRDKYGIRMSVDGIFGPQTEAVTKLYQGYRLPTYPTVPTSGVIAKDNFNRTWTKLAADCYPNGSPIEVCKRHFRY